MARPLNLADAPNHPAFSYRPETGEDPYHAFLGVPLLRGGQVQRPAQAHDLADQALARTHAGQVDGQGIEALGGEQLHLAAGPAHVERAHLGDHGARDDAHDHVEAFLRRTAALDRLANLPQQAPLTPNDRSGHRHLAVVSSPSSLPSSIARRIGDGMPSLIRSDLSRRPSQQFDQLTGLAPLFLGVAADDGAFDAMVQMILQQLGLHPRQRRAHRLHLGEDVDAVAVFFDHARDPAHLPLDAAQAIGQLGL